MAGCDRGGSRSPGLARPSLQRIENPKHRRSPGQACLGIPVADEGREYSVSTRGVDIWMSSTSSYRPSEDRVLLCASDLHSPSMTISSRVRDIAGCTSTANRWAT